MNQKAAPSTPRVTPSPATPAQTAVRFERTYPASLDEVWSLWTTKDGFAAWWGPQGFRVDVHTLEARHGGALVYDMVADSPEMVAAMKAQGHPTSHATRGVFHRIEPMSLLVLRHAIDFIPGVEPYDNDLTATFEAVGDGVRMTVQIEPHRDPFWTQQSAAGFESQLSKLPGVLAARRG